MLLNKFKKKLLINVLTLKACVPSIRFYKALISVGIALDQVQEKYKRNFPSPIFFLRVALAFSLDNSFMSVLCFS